MRRTVQGPRLCTGTTQGSGGGTVLCTCSMCRGPRRGQRAQLGGNSTQPSVRGQRRGQRAQLGGKSAQSSVRTQGPKGPARGQLCTIFRARATQGPKGPARGQLCTTFRARAAAPATQRQGRRVGQAGLCRGGRAGSHCFGRVCGARFVFGPNCSGGLVRGGSFAGMLGGRCHQRGISRRSWSQYPGTAGMQLGPAHALAHLRQARVQATSYDARAIALHGRCKGPA